MKAPFVLCYRGSNWFFSSLSSLDVQILSVNPQGLKQLVDLPAQCGSFTLEMTPLELKCKTDYNVVRCGHPVNSCMCGHLWQVSLWLTTTSITVFIESVYLFAMAPCPLPPCLPHSGKFFEWSKFQGSPQ